MAMYKVLAKIKKKRGPLGSITTQCSIDLMEEIDRLGILTKSLQDAQDLPAKHQVLDLDPQVFEFCSTPSFFQELLQSLSKEEQFIIKSIVAIRQHQILFESEGLSLEEKQKRAKKLLDTLQLVESFYREMGGIVGYHHTLLQFLCQPKRRFPVDRSQYHAPLGVDLAEPSQNLNELIYHSLEEMHKLAEMYPVGGAADRLRLHDPETGTPIPAAMLSFNGQTLLGKLIQDLQAREYLYFKAKGKQILIPVAMMTSQEKDNHQQVVNLCEKNRWFFRPKEKFSFFCQPLVPVVNKEGRWIVSHPMSPLLKPGGHGVIWKLARDCGVIDWLKEQGAIKAIVRQINNPVSAEDYHLMAFSGYGLKGDKRFGFASCERQVKASEGINVVVEEEREEGFSYTLTNIEYCDFKTYSIQDEPVAPGGSFSKFPSNTNLLFVDLHAIVEAINECPIPGMLVNLKKMLVKTNDHETIEEEVARLESTMQNVADCFRKVSSRRLEPQELSNLDTYITFNKRQKTISATKKEFALGASLLETPEGCFTDVLANVRELLEEHCQFSLPQGFKGSECFTSPSFLFQYHPSLGPVYALIGKKLRGGAITEKSELRLQIAECDIENLIVDGSCLITAERIMGEVGPEGILHYSDQVGRCTLKNVTVRNLGIDYSKENVFWKPLIFRKEACRIILEGLSEFYAEDVTLAGDLTIRVENGFKLTAKEEEGKLVFYKEAIESPSWRWRYYFDEQKALQIEREPLCSSN
jgi:hypothetical protein